MCARYSPVLNVPTAVEQRGVLSLSLSLENGERGNHRTTLVFFEDGPRFLLLLLLFFLAEREELLYCCCTLLCDSSVVRGPHKQGRCSLERFEGVACSAFVLIDGGSRGARDRPDGLWRASEPWAIFFLLVKPTTFICILHSSSSVSHAN